MRPRLIVMLLLIVLLPLALLAGVGTYIAREQRAIRQHQLREFLTSLLAERDLQIGLDITRRAMGLEQRAQAVGIDPASLSALIRDAPTLRQAFVLDDQGRLVYPDRAAPTERERSFLERTQPVWARGELTDLIAGHTKTLQLGRANQSREEPSAETSGWYAWYWDHGTHLLYWSKRPDGNVIGFELDRVRLLADMISILPGTLLPSMGEQSLGARSAAPPTDQSAAALGRTRLLDANGEVLYQWGTFEPQEGRTPDAMINLSAPLQAWRLDYFAPDHFFSSSFGTMLIALICGLVACAALLILLASYFYRESTREMREAAQRVNFVNQVSHELKTPLTNIRLYAELMETRLEADADPQLRRHLDVITGESQRLSRLINNVLTFARNQRRTLALRPETTSLDAIVAETAERFIPALARRGIRIELALNAPAPQVLDPEAIDQIVGNLLSNVEKYAVPEASPAAGELPVVPAESNVCIATEQSGEMLMLNIRDAGPGISVAERERIFLPFHRLSNRLTDGVAGTGIGLTIARELARLHGGDLVLVPSNRGAAFRLTLSPISFQTEPAA